MSMIPSRMAGYLISSIGYFLAFRIFSCLSLILNIRYLHRFQTSITQAVCAHSTIAWQLAGISRKDSFLPDFFFIALIDVNQSTCICPSLVLTNPIDCCSSPVGREQGANLNSSRTKVAITCLRKYCLNFRRLVGPSVLSQLTDIPYAPNRMSPLSSALSGPFVSPCYQPFLVPIRGLLVVSSRRFLHFSMFWDSLSKRFAHAWPLVVAIQND